MEDQFTPYDLSSELNEIGFNEEVLGFYEIYKKSNTLINGKIEVIYDFNDYTGWANISKIYETDDHALFVSMNDLRGYYDNIIKAPLWQQAFDFFIEEFDLVGNVYATGSGWLYEIHDSAKKGGTHRYDCGYEEGDCKLSGAFTTHYKARLACVKKLIELCQKL